MILEIKSIENDHIFFKYGQHDYNVCWGQRQYYY